MITKKYDFLVIERSTRGNLNSLYQNIHMVGCTLDTKGLINMAQRINDVSFHTIHREPPGLIVDPKEAICVLESGGWVVLQFMN